MAFANGLDDLVEDLVHDITNGFLNARNSSCEVCGATATSVWSNRLFRFRNRSRTYRAVCSVSNKPTSGKPAYILPQLDASVALFHHRTGFRLLPQSTVNRMLRKLTPRVYNVNYSGRSTTLRLSSQPEVVVVPNKKKIANGRK
jgi:hypothetical protein